MNKRVAVALCLLALAGTVGFASDVAAVSNTWSVTGGLFQEAQDQYVSPYDWSEVEGTLLFLQFDLPGSTSPSAYQVGLGSAVGPLYLGGFYSGFPPMTTATSDSTTVDVDLLLDANNQITAKQETTRVVLGHTNNSWNTAEILVGIGPVGISNLFFESQTDTYGSFDPGTYLLPGANAAWTALPSVGSASTATTIRVADTAGTLISSSVEEYAQGKMVSGFLMDSLSAGVHLPLGSLVLEGLLGFSFLSTGDATIGSLPVTSYAGFTSYTRQVGSGFPTLAAASQGVLPGQSAADLADLDEVTGYSFRETHAGSRNIQLAPTADVRVKIPVSPTVELTAGATYALSIPLYSNTYTDTSGNEQTVKGAARDWHSITYLPAANGSLVETTRTEIRAWETDTVTELTHTVMPVVTCLFEPRELFRFGVSYAPTLTIHTYAVTSAGSAVQVQSYENGDGATGPEDWVETTTVSRAGSTSSVRAYSLQHQLRTGAQFFLVPKRLRVNLGATVQGFNLARTISEVVTNGVVERTVTRATGGGDPVTTAYDVYTEVRSGASPYDHSQSVNDAGTTPTVTYNAGLTFLFNPNMQLDLKMNAGGGDIFNTTTWSMQMTILFPPGGTSAGGSSAE